MIIGWFKKIFACKHDRLELVWEDSKPVAWQCVYCRKHKEPYEGMERWM